MFRRWSTGFLITAGAAMAPAAMAHQVTQTLAVSANVVPSASVGFEIAAQPLQITARDLDRGYVDVVMKSRVQVATGGRSAELKPAVVLAIEPRADLFKSFSVASDGDGHSARAARGNGHSQLREAPVAVADASSGATAEFRYRFEFSRGAREGQFETTISVAVDL